MIKSNITNWKQCINKSQIFVVLLFVNSFTYAQNIELTKNNWIGFGADLGFSYINPEDVNSLFDTWYNSIGIVVNDDIFKRIHLGLSGTGYISIIPLKYVELIPQYEYSYYPYLTTQSDESNLDVKLTNQRIGLSINLKLTNFRIGGGVYKYYCKMDLKDNFYQFNDTWEGNALGFDFFIGLNYKITQHFGWSYTLNYQFAKIDEITNSQNQTVIITEDDKNFSIDLSGIAFKLGLYFTF